MYLIIPLDPLIDVFAELRCEGDVTNHEICISTFTKCTFCEKEGPKNETL
jgi:hypothetical protein